MKRLLLSFFAVTVFAMAVPSLAGHGASTVRIDGMGIDADDTNDFGNIYNFPHLTSQYANILAVVLGAVDSGYADMLVNWGDRTIDLHFSSMKQGFYGGNALFSNEVTSALGNYSTYIVAAHAANNSGIGSIATGPDPDWKIALSAAMPVGAGSFGARLIYATSTSNFNTAFDDDAVGGDNEDEFDGKATQIGVNVGYGQEDVGPLSSVDVGVRLSFGTAEVSYTLKDVDAVAPATADYVEKVATDGALDIGVKLRGIMDGAGDDFWVFSVGFDSNSLKVVGSVQQDADDDGDYQTGLGSGDTDASITNDWKSTGIDVGIAHNQPVGDEGVFVISLHVMSSNSTGKMSTSFYDEDNYTIGYDDVRTGELDWEQKMTGLAVPIAVGVEDNLFGAFKGRLGIRKNLFVTGTTTTTTGSDYDDVNDTLDDTLTVVSTSVPNEDATVHAGLGVTVGNFYVDWGVRLDILFNGPHFISGVPSSLASAVEVGFGW